MARGDLSLRQHLEKIDISILEDILNASQTALNDTDTILRVSEETGISGLRIGAILPIVIDLSNGKLPEIKSEKDVEKLLRNRTKSSKE